MATPLDPLVAQTLSESLSSYTERYRQLAQENAPEVGTYAFHDFRGVIRAAGQEIARYRPKDVAGPEVALALDTWSHLSAFLQQARFHERILSGDIDLQRIAIEFAEASDTEHCSVTSLILIDGLELDVDQLALGGYAELVKLTTDRIGRFFNGVAPPGEIAASRLDGIFALEVPTQAPNPPWPQYEWDSSRILVERVAQPWLNYINLWSYDKVRCCGVYQKTDSRIVEPIRSLGLEEPFWVAREVGDPEDPIEIEEPYRTLRVDDADALRDHILSLDAGSLRARALGHRLDTALRFFKRVSEAFWEHTLSYASDQDAHEDLIIDAVTGLETLYLDGEQRGKDQLLARRASCLLEEDPARSRSMRRELTALYHLRSAIVHGNERRSAKELSDGARLAEGILRRSIRAFAILGGDQQRIIAAVIDQQLAQQNRQLVAG
jgi:hypothetical protein